MERPRKQTYTVEMYLQRMKDLDIRSDQKVQRLSGQWNNAMTNELIFSVLNGEFIPPIILAAEESSQLYIVDGLQRSTTLMMFRYGGYKITSSLEEPVIHYRAKVLDSEGEPELDGNGDIIWEIRSFDIRHKSYEKLPNELKKAFNEFQLDCVIHENYSQEQISRLVRRYNILKPMTVAQKSLTFCDKYARKIREILKRKFFIECTGYTKNERKNGAVERIILETVMAANHLNNWKKPNQIGQYLNDHATMEEFDILENCIERLENVVTDDIYPLFTSRDSFLLFSLFHKFTGLGLDDGKFADFLAYFKETTSVINLNELCGIDKNASTKDKCVVIKKMEKLENYMLEFFGISKPGAEQEIDSETILEFVRENVSPYTTAEDILQYGEVLDCLAEKSGYSGKLMESGNRMSMVALVAYSFENDLDLDDWILHYCNENNDYISDQTENYQYMKEDLQQYLKLENAA